MNLNPGNYSVQLNGKSSGYAHLYIEPNSKIIIDLSKYSKIEKYETLNWVEFKVIEITNINIGLKLAYPQPNENILIRTLSIYY